MWKEYKRDWRFIWYVSSSSQKCKSISHFNCDCSASYQRITRSYYKPLERFFKKIEFSLYKINRFNKCSAFIRKYITVN